jgi:hypothetical protein
MPVGKGKTLLRCSIRADLYAALNEEARVKEIDLGSVVEGHLEHSRMLTRAEHQIVERRLDALSHGQEQIVGLLESLVSRLEQGPMIHDVPNDGNAPPVATYDQMYGSVSASQGTSEEPSPSPNTEAPKRSWRPW